MNLTDGLDGLAIGPVMTTALTFAAFAYLRAMPCSRTICRSTTSPAPANSRCLCGALLGAGLGFLWFNAPPASIFMGDTGSLALGGLLGTVAVATKHEIALAIVGGLFVLEAVSVIVQVVVVPDVRQARIPHGADTSSLRTEGLDRAADRDPLLDRRDRAGARRTFDSEVAVSGMIPVTTFAGRKVALFGLGGSGLASASALLAGGADVIAGDDGEDRMAQARSAGIPTADLRKIDWSRVAALVLAPGIPLTHPEPHWVVKLAQAAGVEIIGDIELFCRERRVRAPTAPFVAITGTNGKSTTTALTAHLLRHAKRDAQMGGNIGTAILSLEPPHAQRAYVVECSSYQIDLAPTIDPTVGILINLSEDHLDRHGTLEHYGAVKERLVAGVPEGGTAVIGVDDEFCAAAAERIARAGQARRSHFGAAGACATAFISTANRSCWRKTATRMPSRCSAGSARCAGVTMRRTRPAPLPPRWRWGWSHAPSRKGCGRFPASRTGWSRSAKIGDVLFVNDFEGDQRGFVGAGAGVFREYFLDRRRQAEDRRHHLAGKILSAHPQDVSDRRSVRRVCRDA